MVAHDFDAVVRAHGHAAQDAPSLRAFRTVVVVLAAVSAPRTVALPWHFSYCWVHGTRTQLKLTELEQFAQGQVPRRRKETLLGRITSEWRRLGRGYAVAVPKLAHDDSAVARRA